MSTHSTLITSCDGSLALSSHRTHLRVIEGGLSRKATQKKDSNGSVSQNDVEVLHAEPEEKPIGAEGFKSQVKPQRKTASHQAQINPKFSRQTINESSDYVRPDGPKAVAVKPQGQVIAFSSTREALCSKKNALFACAMSIAFVLVLLCGWLISDLRVQNKLEKAFSAASHETVVVHQGDSLWSIAAKHPVYGCTTAQVVHHIREVNGLDSACLMAGMRIEVPSVG